MVALKAASDARMDLDAAMAGSITAWTELNAEAAQLRDETPVLVDVVIAEEADALATRYSDQLRALIRTENALLGLRDAAMERGNGALVGTINTWLRHGKEGAQLHDGVRDTRMRWRSLADRLATDPNATEAL